MRAKALEGGLHGEEDRWGGAARGESKLGGHGLHGFDIFIKGFSKVISVAEGEDLLEEHIVFFGGEAHLGVEEEDAS